MPTLGWFFLGGVLTALGDYSSKKWALAGHPWSWFFLAYGLYVTGALFWFLGFRCSTGEISKQSLIWALMLAIVAILVGIFGFHERPSALNYLGMAMGLVAIMFIQAR